MPYTEKKYRSKISLEQKGNALLILVATSLILFVILAFVKALWYANYRDQQVAQSLFTKNVMGLFALSADGHRILTRPWTLLTHMFVHDNIWKVFTNMLWLWCFGFIMQDLTGNKKIIPVFIYGALGGAVAFFLAYNLLPPLQGFKATASLMGASAGVMAVAVSTTLVSPGYRLFPMIGGGLPLWILTAIYIVTDLALVSISDTGILITHLAGALTGFLFIFFLRRGYDWSEWMNHFFEWAENLFNPDKPKKGIVIKEELFYKSSSSPYTKTAKVTQERIDEILDKINQQGYQFLTDEEKEILKRAGKEGI